MSFIKYVLKTDWATKKHDMAEYRRLKLDVFHLENKVTVLRDRITTRVETRDDLYKPMYGCIQVAPDKTAGQAARYETQCPYFSEHSLGWRHNNKCESCKLYGDRDKYEQAKVDLAIVRGWQKSYWGNIFAQVK